MWGYFLLAFAGFYGVVLLVAMLVTRPARVGAQRILRRFIGGFFGLLRALAPRVHFDLGDRAPFESMRGSVVVANHQSFLDPLLLLSLLPRTSTMVRADFFRVPIFGQVLRACGFVRARGEAGPEWLPELDAQLATGGNVLLFPEGTRSPDGRLARFRRGAFHVARRLGAPLEVVRIDGTRAVYPRGSFCLRLGRAARITVRRVGRVSAEEVRACADTETLMARVRGLLEAPGVAARGRATEATAGGPEPGGERATRTEP